MGFKWTEIDLDYVRESYKCIPVLEICENLNRTEESIRTKVRNMGLKKERTDYDLWSVSDVQILKRLYKTLPNNDLSVLLNRTIYSISLKARRLRISDKASDDWSDNEVRILKKKYAECKIEEILPLLNNRNKASVMCKANKLCLRRKKRNSDNMSTYFYNKDYFKNIDTPNKSYFLGWALTDGNVTIKNNSYQFRLRLNEVDKGILIKFIKQINGNIPIYRRKNNFEVNVCSREFVEHLINHNCIPNKTKTVKPPTINEKYELDFLKGCYDGDGSYVCTDKTKKVIFTSASFSFAEYIRDILNRHDISYRVQVHKTYYNIEIERRKSIKEFVTLMLKTKSCFLNRKYLKMIKLSKITYYNKFINIIT